MLGFKNFRCARIILGGIEFMHMFVKGQMKDGAWANCRPAVLLVVRLRNPHHIDFV
jgi:hypothetical protein